MQRSKKTESELDQKGTKRKGEMSGVIPRAGRVWPSSFPARSLERVENDGEDGMPRTKREPQQRFKRIGRVQ